MPNIKSAKKRVKVTETKTLQNSMIKSALKTTIKKVDESIKAGEASAIETAYTKAVKSIDKAVAKGILHKNTAARKKSSITKKLNSNTNA